MRTNKTDRNEKMTKSFFQRGKKLHRRKKNHQGNQLKLSKQKQHFKYLERMHKR